MPTLLKNHFGDKIGNKLFALLVFVVGLAIFESKGRKEQLFI